MHVSDDLYLGGFTGEQFLGNLTPTAGADPTIQYGVGPMGRVVGYDIVPLALATANVAALQAQTGGTALTLTAGTGVTKGLAPDGSGAAVYQFDVDRSVSLTSAGTLSAGTFTIVGYDRYGVKVTQTLAGPAINTVNTLKPFASVLSVTPNTTSATTVSVGSSDIFGLPFAARDAGYLISAKWAGVLAQNAGTFVAADGTSPASATTGSVRGTYAQSGAASNGTNRLVILMLLTAAQCGTNPTVVALLGVAQA